jgi:hypothetical protein
MLSICSCIESVRKLLSHVKPKSVTIPFAMEQSRGKPAVRRAGGHRKEMDRF